MTLRRIAAEPWPSATGWLTPENSSEQGRAVVLRAMADLGILETPLGSNRGLRIDRYAVRGGSPLGSYWCGLWVGAVYADCGLLVPAEYGNTDRWVPYIKPGHTPRPGDVILYGSGTDAKHIELVARIEPELLTIGGNRGLHGGATRNGVAVQMDGVTRSDVLGYCPIESFMEAA